MWLKKTSKKQIKSLDLFVIGTGLIRCDLNINPLFRDAIDKCLQYEDKIRIDITDLLKHPMFNISRGLSSSIMRMKTTSKSQPRKSLPIYNKIRRKVQKKISRPVNNIVLNPYVSAFSKPLGSHNYFINNGSNLIAWDFRLTQ
jgi:serine/threonine protein kinase